MSCEAPPQEFELDKADRALHVLTLSEEVYVFRYASTTKVPAELLNNNERQFCSITKSRNELSIVGPKELVVNSGLPKTSEEHCGGPWSVLKLRGPLEHHMVGVMSELARVLKEARISIFTISTWDTDYLLVTKDTYEQAKKALEGDGWKFD